MDIIYMSDYLLLENGDTLLTESGFKLVKTPTEKATAFKFLYIRRDTEGDIEEAAIRVYECTIIDVNTYTHDTQLNDTQMAHMKDDFITVGSGYAVRYTAADFGTIQTNQQLSDFIKTEIHKDPARLAVAIQRVN